MFDYTSQPKYKPNLELFSCEVGSRILQYFCMFRIRVNRFFELYNIIVIIDFLSFAVVEHAFGCDFYAHTFKHRCLHTTCLG